MRHNLVRRRIALLASALALAGPPTALAQSTSGSTDGRPGAGSGGQPARNGGAGQGGGAAATNAADGGATGIGPKEAARQDRELDAIGKQLLDETPKSPAGSTLPTGGGTQP